jgi:hypothetical protein
MPFISGVTGSKGYAGIGISTPDEPEYKGTTMLFAQAAAPTGWVQVTTYNNCGLRLTSASTNTLADDLSGSNFTDQYPATPASQVATGEYPYNMDTHYTTLAEIAGHVHGTVNNAVFLYQPAYGTGPAPLTVPLAIIPPTGQPATKTWTTDYYIGNPSPPTNTPTTPAPTAYTNIRGSNGVGHQHGFTAGIRSTSTNINLNIKYISAIIAKRS